MLNIQQISRKSHIILGVIFALPILLSSVTAVIYVICDEFLDNEELADDVMDFHTLDIIGLAEIYPFIFLIGMAGLVATGLMLLIKHRIRSVNGGRGELS